MLSYIHYTGCPKTLTTHSMLCRTANWSLFKKEPLSGNAGCCRATKFENELVSQFVPIRFSVLIQQLCNPSAICGLWYKCAESLQRYISKSMWIGRRGDQFRSQHGHQIWHLSAVFCGVVWEVWWMVRLQCQRRTLLHESTKTTTRIGSCAMGGSPGELSEELLT